MSSQTKSGELRDVSTRALVRELETREGVKLLLLTSDHDYKTVSAEGPCMVLRITD